MIQRARPDLRPYQDDLIGRVRARISGGCRRVVLVAVTGAGKTVMAGRMIDLAVERGRRVLFLAHRTELIEQAQAKLAQFGVQAGIIQGARLGDPSAAVQVASVQTLVRRLSRPRRQSSPLWSGPTMIDPLASFDLVVVDECHHATAASYRAVLEAYPQAVVIGLTATPYRLDGSGLGDLFDGLEAGPQVADLIRDGYLVQPVVYAPPSPAELAGVSVRAGEYAIDVAERILDRTAPIAEMVAAWQARAGGRLSVGFACSVEHAEHCAAAFRAAGIPSAAIDGGTAAGERAEVLQRLAAGELRVVWNCALLTEGWDLPACACVLLARPTMSRALWRQMVGRGLRSAPEKADCVVLDHVGATHRFGLPDDPDTYSLDGSVQGCAAEPGGGRGVRLLSCRSCARAFDPVMPCCPACGWVVPMALRRDPRATAERQELSLRPAARMTEDDRKGIYLSLLRRAEAKGYASGWAAHRYRERFACYPPRHWAMEYSA
jgi:DNA repair protein RadD